MSNQPAYVLSTQHGINGGEWGNADSNASIFSSYKRRSINMEARNKSIDRLQWTPAAVAASHHIDGQGLPHAVHAEVTVSSKMSSSTEYRLAEMRMAFAASGGLLTVGELSDSNDPDSQSRFAQIAKGIAAREIIGFMWQSEPWVPMFQFETASRWAPRRALQPLFKLLVPLYDAWEMAHWFARPNQWLSGLTPVDQCKNHLEAVLDVAHLEHFIATGKAPQQPAVAPTSVDNAC